MTETIYKLQPDRTVQLRGFDHLGAAAAVHSATPSGFKVSGVFRDPADFAVLVLYDADNFYEHPRLKYLPDFDFSGLQLRFDVEYRGLMPLNSRKYPTIDWPFLDVATPQGNTAQIRLSDHAEVIRDPDEPAWGEFHIEGANLQGFDRLTLWYQNLAFDYIVPGKTSAAYPIDAGTPGQIHAVTVGERSYSYTGQAGDTAASIAAALAARVNGTEPGFTPDPDVTAAADGDALRVTARMDTGATVNVTMSGYPTETLYHVKDTTVCRALAAMINGVDYEAAQTPYSLQATATGTTLKIETVEGGYDANFITLYAVWKTETLRTAETKVALKHGDSRAVLRVTLNFDALNLPQIRSMWMTLAPRLSNGEEYAATEWEATFTNWEVTGPETKRRLYVAGPASARVRSQSPSCRYDGAWTDETGFYLDNIARRTSVTGSAVTVRYFCGEPHQLWVGTSLWTGAGTVQATLDGEPLTSVALHLDETTPVVTRRKLADLVMPGEHLVRLELSSAGAFVFDFLEAAVAGDVPASAPARMKASPALDYSTDHTYKLPPSRIVWMLDKLGYRGPVNEYIGVFWWNERKRTGGVTASKVLEFSGDFLPGDQILITIGGQVCGKSVFPNEPREALAKHFEYLINATYVGVWAKAEGDELTIHSRSASPAYEFDVSTMTERVGGSTGVVLGAGRIEGGSMGVWEVDPLAERALNRGAEAWHADFYAACAERGLAVTTACSMELVNPPAEFAARYADGSAAVTDVGFASLKSTHCAFRSDMLEYHRRVYTALADLQAQAGLTPSLQCGEFTWWYFPKAMSMAYYDSETAAAAAAALGRPLQAFTGPDDDPQANGGADATFLRNRLRDYVAGLMAHVRASYPAARFEVLFPYDVNHPRPRGVHNLGGRLNRHVNLPVEWETPASGLDTFKLEALDFGAWSRDLDLMRECQEFAASLGWPRERLKMMTPVFRAGYPWHKEAENALSLGFAAVNLWAFDHVCLYGLEWPTGRGLSKYQG